MGLLRFPLLFCVNIGKLCFSRVYLFFVIEFIGIKLIAIPFLSDVCKLCSDGLLSFSLIG